MPADFICKYCKTSLLTILETDARTDVIADDITLHTAVHTPETL